MPESPNPRAGSINPALCREYRDILAKKFDGGISDLKEIQKTHRKEFREDFGHFAEKTDKALGKIAIAHATLSGDVKANRDGVTTISKRGWGLLIVVLAAMASAIAAAIIAAIKA